MAINRDIQYINRDFGNLRQSLINYSKTYFPTTYNDFSPSSPGMMFMELSSYVGDVLSFYQDNQFQETFLQYAREAKNLYDLAYMMGYKPKVTGVAMVNIDFYQQLPASQSIAGNYVPDYDYALLIQENSQITSTSNSNVNFLVEDSIDFDTSSSLDPTTVSVYQLDGLGNPEYFLIKKSRQAISATINTTTITAPSTPQEFFTTIITASDIIGILSITDEDGNEWYEVDTLGQEMVYDSLKNTNPNDPNNYVNEGDAPYLLKLKQVARRFTSRFSDPTTLQIQFGAGSSNDVNEEVTPNSNNVGLGLPFEKSKLTAAYSPQNFIFTSTYGIAPTGNLTVKYLTGGGATANAPAGNLTKISNNQVNFQKTSLNPTVSNVIFNSLTVNNLKAASGGSDGDTNEEIRQNSISNFSSQLRNVTADDYLVRALSMTPKYGVVSKAYIEQTKLNTLLPGEIPTTLSLYVLSADSNNNLTLANTSLKQNLQTYLSQYRIIGDSINIKDAFIVNVGVDFEISVRPNFNSNEVLRACLNSLKTYFNIDNWQINEPIQINEIFLLLDKIQGVQTVKAVNITNKVGTSLGYSQYAYDIPGATLNKVIYPSIDPMIFEVKNLTTDIKGKIVNL
tara:strand:+ start:3328 stop:5193 length:1866 start_codon:yes stop_codon:yes gene_type:complete